jgi:hypothetical protein
VGADRQPEGFLRIFQFVFDVLRIKDFRIHQFHFKILDIKQQAPHSLAVLFDLVIFTAFLDRHFPLSAHRFPTVGSGTRGPTYF